ncbi:MAG: hypothetical protein ABFD60_11195 [Bryobacteraceae bacterium]
MSDFRQATAKEQALVESFCARVHRERANIDRALQTGNAAVDCQAWIKTNAIPYPGVVFDSGTDGVTFKEIAAKATRLELYAAGYETGKLCMRPNASGTDFAVMVPLNTAGPDLWEGVGLGAFPVVLVIVVAGVVLVAAAISVCTSFYATALTAQANKQKQIALLDAWALKQGGSTAASWQDFKKVNKETNPSFWSGLQNTLSQIAPILGLGLLAYALFTFGPRRGSEKSAPRAEEAET